MVSEKTEQNHSDSTENGSLERIGGKDGVERMGEGSGYRGSFRGGAGLPPPSRLSGTTVPPGSNGSSSGSNGTRPPLSGCLEVAAHNARAIYRTISTEGPGDVWFGSGQVSRHVQDQAAAVLDSVKQEGHDPLLWGGVAAWVADAHELTDFSRLVSPALYPLLRQVLSSFPADALWGLVSRPGHPAAALESATLVFPAGGGSARRRSGNTNDPADIGLYCKAIGWLIGARDQIARYGVHDYWDARYHAWTDYTEVLQRKDPGRPTLYPSVWDLIERTKDPLTNPDAIARPREPLHRFLGISDSVVINAVAAGFRPNLQHEAAAINAQRGGGPRLKGTFEDVTDVSPLSYRVRSGDYFRAQYHYRQENALHITPANFPAFASLFPSERELKYWWFVEPIRKGAPPLDLYRQFGGDPSAVDAEGRWMGREVEWRKSL